MFTFRTHHYAIDVAFVIKFLDPVEPLQTALQTVLIGAVVDHHDEVWIFTHAQCDWLVELVTAQIEKEQLHTEILISEGDDFGIYLCPLGLNHANTYHVIVATELVILFSIRLNQSWLSCSRVTLITYSIPMMRTLAFFLFI